MALPLAGAPLSVAAVTFDPVRTAGEPRLANAFERVASMVRGSYALLSTRAMRPTPARTLPFPLPALPAAFRTPLLQAA